MKEINGRLATLSQNFGNNLLDETNSFEMHLIHEEDVADLPKNCLSLNAEVLPLLATIKP